MLALLQQNPLLLLFLVAAIGYPLGRIRIGGASLGVASVLFVGLAFGALDENLKLPEIVYQLGLVVFVYTIGLTSGAVFFTSLRRKGLRDNALVLGMLLMAAAVTAGLAVLLGLRGTYAAGIYAGTLTNTPALAGVLEHIKVVVAGAQVEQMLTEPVVAYSLTYPVGVISMILVVYVMGRIWKVDYVADARRVQEPGATAEPLLNRTVRVTSPAATGISLSDLSRKLGFHVIFGRVRRAGEISVASGATTFELDDLVSMIGAEDDLREAVQFMGEEVPEHLEQDLTVYDKRRFFVSNPQVAGRRLRELRFLPRYGALITRLRRGDIELVPHGETMLNLGDQVRVLAHHEQMDDIGSLLGDSYRAISEVDVLTFSLGLALGLLVGQIPFPLPGGITIQLGMAGGPLIVALVLSAVGRTGPLVWSIPFSANMTLRQIGLVLFLAGVGTRAGYTFVSTLAGGQGYTLMLAALVITVITGVTTLWLGYRVFKIPMGLLTGMLASLQTSPALLGFALEQSGNELPNIGYATVYPVSTVTKIVLAQVLLVLFL